MDYKQAKQKFIDTWGSLGSQWGINKTMAKIHAYLMVTPNPCSIEEIMEALSISRGNDSMNIRSLMDWGIVYKVFKPGQRKEFYIAEKDLDELAVKISRERSRRELVPALKILKEVSSIQTLDNSQEQQHFLNQTTKLHAFVSKANQVLEKITEHKDNWITKLLMKVIK